MAAQPKPLAHFQPDYLSEGGVLSWLMTVDHKRIALMYGIAALVFMALGGIEAMLIRV